MAQTNEEKHAETYAAAEARVRELDPAALALRAEGSWTPASAAPPEGSAGLLTLESLGRGLRLSWPDLSFESDLPLLLSFPWRLLTLHHLLEVGPGPVDQDWIGYRELPDGLFYANTVTREVEAPLARAYGTDPEGLLEALARLGGTPLDLADAAGALRPFPKLPLAIALWVEDEEFPAKVKVLYDRAGAGNLPLQDLRIVAEVLGKALLGSTPEHDA